MVSRVTELETAKGHRCRHGYNFYSDSQVASILPSMHGICIFFQLSGHGVPLFETHFYKMHIYDICWGIEKLKNMQTHKVCFL
jgi:hypothetical protein